MNESTSFLDRLLDNWRFGPRGRVRFFLLFVLLLFFVLVLVLSFLGAGSGSVPLAPFPVFGGGAVSFFSFLGSVLHFPPVFAIAVRIRFLVAILGILDVHLGEKVLLEGHGEGLDVHVVAVATALAAAVDVLLALGIKEVSDGRVLGLDLLAVEEAAIDVLLGILGEVLVTVLDVDVADNVVSQVVHHDHVLDFPILHHLLENLLVECLVPNFAKAYTSPSLLRRPDG